MPEDLPDGVPSMYSMHITLIHHANEIKTIKEYAKLQQRALDDINKGIRYLNLTILTALLLAVVKFALSGGFNA
jgi:hypothetical protein